MRKSAFLGLCGVLYLAGAGCDRGEKGHADPADREVRTALVSPASRADLTNNLTVAGQFEPYQDVDLHAKVSGYIRRIYVDIGDRVHSGQTIATLEVPELKAQVAGAQAAVRHNQSVISRAQSEILRAQANHDALHSAYSRLLEASKLRPGLVTQQELDDAHAKDMNSEAEIDSAKSSLDAARQNLGVSQADSQRIQILSDYSVVTAPFNGVVTKRYADTGSLIQAGTASSTQSMPVIRLAQSDLLRLRMPVPEVDVPFIKTGGAVGVHVQATGQTFSGKIIRFSRAMDASTRTMLAEVDVPNPKLTLNPGMYAETSIELEKRDRVLTVPAQAIFESGEQSYVLALDAANRVVKQAVTLGLQGPKRVEVTSGLSENTLVIVSGQSSYAPGETVRPRRQEAK